MTELAVTAVVLLAGIAGWMLRTVWARASQARAGAYLRQLLAPRVAIFRTGYARQGGGRR